MSKALLCKYYRCYLGRLRHPFAGVGTRLVVELAGIRTRRWLLDWH